MAIRTFKENLALLIFFSLMIVTDIASSATATATVTANIVPMTSLSTSGTITLSSSSSRNQTKSISKDGINLTTIGHNTAKFDVKSSYDMTYSVSISPSINIFDKAGIKASRSLHIISHKSGDIGMNDLLVNARLSGTMSHVNRSRYYGKAIITVNYN